MPQVPLNSCKSLLFHGGDTGSIPVLDAKAINHLQESHFCRGSIKLDRFLFANT